MTEALKTELANQIAEKHALVVVGTGVSLAATGGNDLASWKGLIASGIKRCVEINLCKPTWAASQKGLLEGDLDDLLGVAEQVSRRLGWEPTEPCDGEWNKWLRKTTGALRASQPELIQAIRDLDAPIATLNYDNLLTEVTGRRPITWKNAERWLPVLQSNDKAILHLHGHWDQPSSVVLGIRSYDAVMGKELAQHLQRVLASLHSLVFIGCSGTVQDPNFSALIGWMRDQLRGAEHSHYLLLRESEPPPIDASLLRQARIVTLRYGAAHADLLPFIRSLASSSSSASLPSVSVEHKDVGRSIKLPASTVEDGAIGERTNNKGKTLVPESKICVSYAWSDDQSEEGQQRDAIVDQLCAEAERRGIHILRDKKVLGLGERISQFMQRIGAADRVFVILSDKYLKSPACMFELCEIWRNSRHDDDDFLSRIRVYTLPCARIWTPRERAGYAIHWKKEHDKLESLVRNHGYDILGEKDMQKLRQMNAFRQHIGDILALVADVLQPRSFDDLIRYGLNDILAARPQPTNGSNPEAHKYTGPLGAPASAVDGVAGGGRPQGAQDESRQRDESRAQENKNRLQILKKEIAEILYGSPAALAAFQSAAVSRGWGPIEENSGHESPFVEWIMNANFAHIKDALLEAYENLKNRRGSGDTAAIEDISRHILPWLYVAGTAIETLWWNGGRRDIVGLPCGLETFTEIVIAGLERRQVFWDSTNPNWPEWPDGEWRIPCPPEIGITPKLDTVVRDELWRMTTPPPQIQTKSPEIRDAAIRNQLEFMESKRLKPYLIVTIPEEQTDRTMFMAAVDRLRGRYLQMEFVVLNESLLLDKQRLFNEIRHLLVPGSL